MAVPMFMRWIEDTSFSIFLRETETIYGFYGALTIHVVGLALLVGLNVMIDLRILGVGRDIPLAPLKRLYGLIWFGLFLSLVSGLLLLICYPTKEFTNPLFYVKVTLIVLGVFFMHRIGKRVLGDDTLSEEAMEAKGRSMALLSLVVWAGTIAAGRMLAYTYTYLLYGVIPGGRRL